MKEKHLSSLTQAPISIVTKVLTPKSHKRAKSNIELKGELVDLKR
jgi:hypothetical protein